MASGGQRRRLGRHEEPCSDCLQTPHSPNPQCLHAAESDFRARAQSDLPLDAGIIVGNPVVLLLLVGEEPLALEPVDRHGLAGVLVLEHEPEQERWRSERCRNLSVPPLT